MTIQERCQDTDPAIRIVRRDFLKKSLRQGRKALTAAKEKVSQNCGKN
jgi:hypothetical protein